MGPDKLKALIEQPLFTNSEQRIRMSLMTAASSRYSGQVISQAFQYSLIMNDDSKPQY